jgi:hypothetical protein
MQSYREEIERAVSGDYQILCAVSSAGMFLSFQFAVLDEKTDEHRLSRFG